MNWIYYKKNGGSIDDFGARYDEIFHEDYVIEAEDRVEALKLARIESIIEIEKTQGEFPDEITVHLQE